MIDTATGEQLLAAILEQPDRDDLRLIYADWLEETGADPARGDLIRVQCAWHRLWFSGIDVNDIRVCDLEKRLKTILTPSHFWEWFGKEITPAWPGSPAVKIESLGDLCEVGYFGPPERPHWKLQLRRGFFEGAKLPGDDFVSHADTLTALHPIREVTLTSEPETTTPTGFTFLCGRPGVKTWYKGSSRATVLDLLGQAWPRIKFNLPIRVGNHAFVEFIASEPVISGQLVALSGDGTVRPTSDRNEAIGVATYIDHENYRVQVRAFR